MLSAKSVSSHLYLTPPKCANINYVDVYSYEMPASEKLSGSAKI